MPEASSRNPVAIQTIRAWAGETILERGQDYQRKLRRVWARQGKEMAGRDELTELRRRIGASAGWSSSSILNQDKVL